MIVDLTYRIDVPSTQKATALRDQCALWLEEQDDCTLIHSGQSKAMPNWKVAGVVVDTAQPFIEDVEAEDEAEAKQKVEGTGKKKTKVVAMVQPA